jgi:sigma-B regulation protein RsbU (phosphoserine phosphatase)
MVDVACQRNPDRSSDRGRQFAIDALPCGVLGYDDDGRIVLANRQVAGDLGHAVDELVGLRLDTVLPPAARLYFVTHVQPALKLRGRIDEVYLTLRARDGALLPVLASALRDASGAAPATLLTVLPMQRRAEFEQRLIDARRTAEELLRTRTELLERRDAEARESAELAERLRALTARIDADHSDASRATARSLHEEVAQDLAALKWQLDALQRNGAHDELQEQLAGLEQLAAQTLSQVRELSYDLYPAVLEHSDLTGTVRAAARAFEQEFGLPVDVTLLQPVPALDRSVQLLLYRFVEEALRNTVLHGGASRAAVTIGGTPEAIELAVFDDGAGDPGAPAVAGDFGLLAARERLRRLGGSLAITGREPRGLAVVARIPREP